ncbi:MAG: hypothetical protein IJL56_07180 [Bacteroidales bacterium]|nr:hypothetical protein [Bacteroidales bacterium]
MAHDRKDVRADRSLKTMYIEPIVRIFRENGGRMWKGSDDRLDLVIDLKTAESMPGAVATGSENRSVSGVRRTPGTSISHSMSWERISSIRTIPPAAACSSKNG